jgi:hypothetical protein
MRRRRPFYISLVMLFATAVLVVGGLFAAAKREPAFYTAASQPRDWDTHQRSSKLLTRVVDLQNDVRAKEEWGETLTEDDLNAFFIENMGPKGRLTDMLPKGFHSPRVSVQGDRVYFGVKYRDGFWSSVLWLELRVWLVADQINVAAVEVCNLKTGRLPFGAQSILDKVSDIARDSSIDVTWYRYKNNPVGIFKFFAKQPRATSQVLTLDARDGKLVIAGRSYQDALPPALTGVTQLP